MKDDDKPGRPGQMQTEVNQRKPRGRLGRDVQSKIGQQLRAMYDGVVSEGVPDRFTEMLRQARRTERDEKKKGSNDAVRPRTAKTRCWRRCRVCAPSRSRCPAMSTGRTISCRRRCCARSPISTRSSPAPTCRPGCSPSCATCSARNTASAGARWRIPTARYAESLKSHPEQSSHLEFKEFRTALAKLPPDQREALILVGASGFSYEEAAAICECAVGTIKSRVNRARTRLADLLSIESAEDFGPDHTTRAILAAGGGRG